MRTRTRRRPSQAVLATIAAIGASAAIGVLLGAYVHEVRVEVPVATVYKPQVTTSPPSTTVSTVVVTVVPETSDQPREIAERHPVSTRHHSTPSPTASPTPTTSPVPTTTSSPSPSPAPEPTVTANPLPRTPASCTSLLGCLIGTASPQQ